MTYDKHTDKPPHVELYLAGDFSSPFEVLTANDFSASQKREIFETWHADLMRRGGYSRHSELLLDIEHSLKSLRPEVDGSSDEPIG
ncbi:MAG: hypothetical protein APF80_13620 [Alphaproteobacteria bacterium BRH_c36]|nr:MAG: hypothetical protein APF80_13620 [Alphaproteobacteria bacterium BRH_c36]